MARDPVLDPSGLARATERLASLIPGYSGYKKRERLREEDRAVRESVSRQLALILGRMERALRVSLRGLPPQEVEAADRILRALERQKDRIRFAPEGFASLFARREIKEHDLETLIALDTGLWSTLDALDGMAGEWDRQSRTGDPGWPHEAIKNALFELEDALDEREAFLRS